MGFQGMGSAPRYLCLSTDVKPVTGHGIEAGATALETDTGDMYIFDGAAWVLKADNVKVTGSKAEQASAQDTQVATTVVAYARAAGATEIGIFVESGSVRIRTDGTAATATTGVPLGDGFVEFFAVASVSVYYVENSIITVVSR